MVSAKSLVPNWLPRLVTPAGVDQASVLRGLRSDAKGGVFAGYAGSYDSTLRERVTGNSGAGGNVTVNSSAVASGYLHIIQQVMLNHDDSTARIAALCIASGATMFDIETAGALGKYNVVRNNNDIVLAAGEKITGMVYSLADNKSVVLSIIGYKVRLQ